MHRKHIFSRRDKARRRLPWGILVLALLLFVCWLIPIEQNSLSAFNGLAALPVFPATFTPVPKPTREHIGTIVFTCTHGDYNQLCLVNADGTGLQRLTSQAANDYYPVYLPQGDNAILFASNRNYGMFDLYLLLLNGMKIAQLTIGIGNIFSPSPSPDGRRVVFANRVNAGPTSLWVMDVNGSNAHQIYEGPNTIVGAAWSPDGHTIAFAMAVNQPNAFEIFLMDVDGSNVRQLTHGLGGIGGSLDWSPDGKKLYIYAGPQGDKDIYSLDASTGAAIRLTNGGNNAAASVSPDGQWLAFNSTRTGNANIFIMHADGSSMRQVTNDLEPDWQPHWAP